MSDLTLIYARSSVTTVRTYASIRYGVDARMSNVVITAFRAGDYYYTKQYVHAI